MQVVDEKQEINLQWPNIVSIRSEILLRIVRAGFWMEQWSLPTRSTRYKDTKDCAKKP